MLFTFLRKFSKEKTGAPIVEYVILLAFIGTVFVASVTPLREGVINVFQGIADEIRDDDTAEEAIGSLPNYDEMIGVSIQMSPSENLTPNTPVVFSATATGGKGPYYFEWTNYSGEADGKRGEPEFYTSGNHTVSVKITDDTGSIKHFNKTFEVKNVPATLNVSDTTPTVGDSIVASVAATDTVQCQFLAPQNSSNCSVTIPVSNDTPFDVAVDVCKEGICQTLKETINPKYEALTLERIVGIYPEEIYESDFVQFKAVASGGSGNLIVEWQNYTGPDKPNVNGPQQKYAQGDHIVRARVCEVDGSECTEWMGHAFTVKPNTSESVPLITWLDQSEVYAFPNVTGPIIDVSNINCVGNSGECDFGTVTFISGPAVNGTEGDPTSDGTNYTYPGANETDVYTYNIQICDDIACRDNEFTVYVSADGNPLTVAVQTSFSVVVGGSVNLIWEASGGSGDYSASSSQVTEYDIFGSLTGPNNFNEAELYKFDFKVCDSEGTCATKRILVDVGYDGDTTTQ